MELIADLIQKEPMKEYNRTALADPLSFISSTISRIYTLWLRWTFPFYSLGSDFWAHYSCDIRREMVCHIKVGKSVWLDRHVWLNIPFPPETDAPAIILEDGVKIGRRCMISAKNRVSVGRDAVFGPSVLVTDHLHEFKDITVPIGLQGVTTGGTVRIEEGWWSVRTR